MSVQPLRNAALVALTGIGALVVLNNAIKPSKTQGIVGVMRRDLDSYNSSVHEEQDPRDTLFDRKKIMADTKARKPWNMSYADKEMKNRVAH